MIKKKKKKKKNSWQDTTSVIAFLAFVTSLNAYMF